MQHVQSNAPNMEQLITICWGSNLPWVMWYSRPCLATLNTETPFISTLQHIYCSWEGTLVEKLLFRLHNPPCFCYTTLTSLADPTSAVQRNYSSVERALYGNHCSSLLPSPWKLYHQSSGSWQTQYWDSFSDSTLWSTSKMSSQCGTLKQRHRFYFWTNTFPSKDKNSLKTQFPGQLVPMYFWQEGGKWDGGLGHSIKV
jgi:hypothetical protein